VRLFTAVELPSDVREQLAAAARAINYKISLVAEANLHITLKFLGEVPESKVAELCEEFQRVSAVGPVPLRAEKVECFPQRGPIRIIAVRIGGDTLRLVQLYKNIEQACERYGIPPERRPRQI